MVRIASSLAAIALATSQLASAQTFTECDPTKRTNCAPRVGLNQAEYNVNFKQTNGVGADKNWKNSAKAVTFGANGAEFNLKATGESVTYATDFYIFFGYVEVKMRSAPGAGIVSSFVLQSDDLDEIDWEMIGSETDKVQSNYFGKGNTTTYDRGGFHNVVTPADTMHTYALNWTKESTTWLIDGAPVRVVKFADAVNGQNYPQTPMNIRLGNWIAGTPGNSPGTVKWAGGIADMTQAPFNMYVESVKVINYNPAESYHYTDLSGSWQSIKYQVNSVSAAIDAQPALPAPADATVASPVAGLDSDNSAATPAVPAAGTVTITPADNNGKVNVGVSDGASPGVVTINPVVEGQNLSTPTFTIGVVNVDQAASALPSTLVSSSVMVAAVTTPSAVVSLAAGNGTSATYRPLLVTTNDAISRTTKSTLVAAISALSFVAIWAL